VDEDFEDFNDEDANNDVEIEELTYSFPLCTSTQVVLRLPMRITLLVPSTSDGDGGFENSLLARATLSTT